MTASVMLRQYITGRFNVVAPNSMYDALVLDGHAAHRRGAAAAGDNGR